MKIVMWCIMFACSVNAAQQYQSMDERVQPAVLEAHVSSILSPSHWSCGEPLLKSLAMVGGGAASSAMTTLLLHNLGSNGMVGASFMVGAYAAYRVCKKSANKEGMNQQEGAMLLRNALSVYKEWQEGIDYLFEQFDHPQRAEDTGIRDKFMLLTGSSWLKCPFFLLHDNRVDNAVSMADFVCEYEFFINNVAQKVVDQGERSSPVVYAAVRPGGLFMHWRILQRALRQKPEMAVMVQCVGDDEESKLFHSALRALVPEYGNTVGGDTVIQLTFDRLTSLKESLHRPALTFKEMAYIAKTEVRYQQFGYTLKSLYPYASVAMQLFPDTPTYCSYIRSPKTTALPQLVIGGGHGDIDVHDGYAVKNFAQICDIAMKRNPNATNILLGMSDKAPCVYEMLPTQSIESVAAKMLK